MCHGIHMRKEVSHLSAWLVSMQCRSLEATSGRRNKFLDCYCSPFPFLPFPFFVLLCHFQPFFIQPDFIYSSCVFHNHTHTAVSSFTGVYIILLNTLWQDAKRLIYYCCADGLPSWPEGGRSDGSCPKRTIDEGSSRGRKESVWSLRTGSTVDR